MNLSHHKHAIEFIQSDLKTDYMEDEASYHITITRVDGDGPCHELEIHQAIHTTLKRHHTLSATLDVALVNDQRMASLNQKHLDHEGPTDVLAFDLRDQPYDSDKELLPQQSVKHLEGEIILSMETAARESQKRGITLQAELALYAVHGTLHLLGYGDHDPQDADRMYAMEDEILSAIGVESVDHLESE